MLEFSQRQLLILAVSIVLLVPQGAIADHEIFYKGMHAKKARIEIDGRVQTIGKGQTRKWVKVISVKKSEVVISVHGTQYRYKKKSKTGQKLQDVVEIPFDPGLSAYYGEGLINGKRVGFIVDTGAAHVAFNTIAAKCSDATIGTMAINIKVELEKSREQTQNIV